MTYAELDDSELIILAAEYVGRGVPIPHEIAAKLGSDLVLEIENPGVHNECEQTSSKLD